MPAARFAALLALGLTVSCGAEAPPEGPPPLPTIQSAPGDTSAALAAARTVAAAARYATLITLGPDGHPQARVVDPFPPEADFTVWIATNARSRKVAEIAADPRVTLMFFDAAGGAYVTVIGDATAVDDPEMKSRYWKTDWAEFYPDGPQGADYLLLRLTAHRLEVSAEHLGILNDPVTWRPAIVELR